MEVVRRLLQRIARKLKSILPIVLLVLPVLGILSLVIYLATPYLPDEWQQTLGRLTEGDLASARAELRALGENAGIKTALVFVGVQVLQVVFAPIPGQLAGLLGGSVFGFWLGLLLTMTGLALGSFLAISLGRLLGKHVVRKFIPASFMEKFDALVGKDGLWNFFLLFLLPVFPDDAACFVAGLTRLRIWKLVLLCLAGRLPGMAVLTYVGAGAVAGSTAAYVVFIVAMVLSVGVWLFSEELEQWFVRTFRRPQPNPDGAGAAAD